MKKLVTNIIKRIKEEHIVPEPRWKFLLRKITIWVIIGSIVLLGAISVSIIYYLLSQLDWELPQLIHRNRIIYALLIFPYFWLLWVIILVEIIFIEIRKTEAGYRFNWLKIILIVTLTIFFTGFFLAKAGFGKRFNNLIKCRVPYYQQIMITKKTQWMQPQKGFLAGNIDLIIRSKRKMRLTDLNKKKWEIILNKNTFIAPKIFFKRGEKIKIIGRQKNEHSFEASQIRPWTGRNNRSNKK